MPAPAAMHDGLDREFWEAARRHELVVQRCNKCATFQFGPEWICHKCHTLDVGWHRVSGRGRIYSWERIWNPVHPALKDAGPYIDRKSTRLNSSHIEPSRMPSSA